MTELANWHITGDWFDHTNSIKQMTDEQLEAAVELLQGMIEAKLAGANAPPLSLCVRSSVSSSSDRGLVDPQSPSLAQAHQ